MRQQSESRYKLKFAQRVCQTDFCHVRQINLKTKN